MAGSADREEPRWPSAWARSSTPPRELQGELELIYLFIARDLAVVQQMSRDVLVRLKGRAVGHREATELFADPREDSTKMLLAATPPAEPRAGARV